MDCWICGAPATTGEHLPKQSSLKELFPKVSQSRPLYYHGKGLRNHPLQSTNSKKLKLFVLCADCNNRRTRDMDLAWDEFIAFLRRNEKSLKTGDALRFYRLFGCQARRKKMNLHLYIVKIFGCYATEHGMPVDIAGMADAIKETLNKV